MLSSNEHGAEEKSHLIDICCSLPSLVKVRASPTASDEHVISDEEDRVGRVYGSGERMIDHILVCVLVD